MRLKSYLNESFPPADVRRLVETLKQDCGPFLDAIKPILGTGKCFVRRIHGQPVSLYIKKTARTDRRPSDTDPEMHQAFDDEFKKKFGWGARSEGVFTYPAKDISKCFEGQHIFYPIGEFKFVYSPTVPDLFVEMMTDDPDEEVPKLFPSYTSKNLLGVFHGKFDGRNLYPEVMFKCKQYYLVNKNVVESLLVNGVF